MRSRAKDASLDNILTDREIEAIAEYLRDSNIDEEDLTDKEFLAIVNRYRSAENKLIPSFTLPTRRSARLSEKRKRTRNKSAEYE